MHLFRQYGNRLALTASTTARADCYLDKNPLFIFLHISYILQQDYRCEIFYWIKNILWRFRLAKRERLFFALNKVKRTL